MNLTHAKYDITEPVFKMVPYLHAKRPALKAGDIITVDGLRFYKVGSVVSSCTKYDDCPIEAIERAVRNANALHFIFSLPVSLTAHSEQKKPALAVCLGSDEYMFEGRLFTIASAPNNNLQFIQTDIINCELYTKRGYANIAEFEPEND